MLAKYRFCRLAKSRIQASSWEQRPMTKHWLAILVGLALVGQSVGASTSQAATTGPSRRVVQVYHPDEKATLALAPLERATATAIKDGQWDEPATWGGKLPKDGDHVLIPTGRIVLLDSQESARLATVRVDGDLEFAPTEHSRLLVETMIVAPWGACEIGTSASPITGRAEIVFLNNGTIDPAVDPKQLSKGLISLGEFSIYGAPMTGWSWLSEAPKAGATKLVLDRAPNGWRKGDRLLVPAVSRDPKTSGDELRVIEEINGNEITIEALKFDHLTPEGESGIRLPVANLDRHVELRSESSEPGRRGHVMIMHSHFCEVAYAEFVDLGRTDKLKLITDDNVRGRYSLHFHRLGTGRPVNVAGVVVHGSPGWGVVNHSSHINVTESVSFDVVGAGFVTEAGDERGSFVGNMAVRGNGTGARIEPRHKKGDFAHGGHGFWVQGCHTKITDNVACGHRDAAFFVFGQGFKEPDTGAIADKNSHKVQLAGYARNVAFASGTGHSFEWADPRTASPIEDVCAWNTGRGMHIKRSKIDIHRALLIGSGEGCGITFVGPYHGQGSIYDSTVRGWGCGTSLPREGETVCAGGTWANEVDFNVLAGRSGSVTFRELPSTVKISLSWNGDIDFHGQARQFFVDDGKQTRRVYLQAQAPDHVPFKRAAGKFAGLSNKQIFDQFGLEPLGAIAPADAVALGPFLVER
jgi:hypothetical protein